MRIFEAQSYFRVLVFGYCFASSVLDILADDKPLPASTGQAVESTALEQKDGWNESMFDGASTLDKDILQEKQSSDHLLTADTLVPPHSSLENLTKTVSPIQPIQQSHPSQPQSSLEPIQRAQAVLPAQTIQPAAKVLNSGWIQRGVSYLKSWGQDGSPAQRGKIAGGNPGDGNFIMASPSRWGVPNANVPTGAWDVAAKAGARRSMGVGSIGARIDRSKFQEKLEAIGPDRMRKLREEEARLTALIRQAQSPNGHHYASRAVNRNSQGEQRYKDALEDATRAVGLLPGDFRAHGIRAVTLNNVKEYSDAVKEAGLAIEINSRDAFAHIARAQAYHELGRREEALRDLQAAVDIDRQYAQLADDYVQGMKAEARALTNRNSPNAAAGARLFSFAPSGRAYLRVWAGAVLIGIFMLYVLLALWRIRPRDTGAPIASGNAGLVESPSPGTAGRPAFSWGSVSVSRIVSVADIAARTGREENGFRPGGLEGFQILRQIGQGGMGVVYEAMDLTLHRRVAIKKMRDEIAGDGRERKRFMKEARTVAALKHPNIVEIYSVLERDGGIFMVFEHLAGEPLSQILSSRKHLTFQETMKVIRQVAQALDHAHGRGIIHRDLKPSNIMVAAESAPQKHLLEQPSSETLPRTKVMDFGIARHVQETLSTMSRGEVVGTPQYMAPEQENGTAFNESDVYALGVCAYEMLAGRLPFEFPAQYHRKWENKFLSLREFLPNFPAEADAVIVRALDIEPRRRYPSAGAMAAAFERGMGPLLAP